LTNPSSAVFSIPPLIPRCSGSGSPAAAAAAAAVAAAVVAVVVAVLLLLLAVVETGTGSHLQAVAGRSQYIDYRRHQCKPLADLR